MSNDLLFTNPIMYYMGSTPPYPMVLAIYRWQHLPSGNSGTASVYLDRLADLPVLLNRWNSQSSIWHYSN